MGIQNVTRQFVTAGNAVFTVMGPSKRYTYQVRQAHNRETGAPEKKWFVSVLTGSDNTRDYTYLGMLDAADGNVKLTKGSKMRKCERCQGTGKDGHDRELPPNAYTCDDCRGTGLPQPLSVVRWALAWVWTDRDYAPDGYFIEHSDNCGRCGRTLTTRESLREGLGPECLAMVS